MALRAGALAIVCVLASTWSEPAMAQQQFIDDPLPFTIATRVTQQFMQLTNESPQQLHTGIDIETGVGKPVVAPLAFGNLAKVFIADPALSIVILEAQVFQGGARAYFLANHVTPDPNLVVGTMIPTGTIIGETNAMAHLHAEVFLVVHSSADDKESLVNPQLNAFAAVGGWNQDSYAPRLDNTVVHESAVGGETVFEIDASDQADNDPSVFNGIYAAALYVDGNAVDAIAFDRWRGKNGTYPPIASDYYFCTGPACTPTGGNNPNAMRYKLKWLTQAGDHVWRIDVFDAKGNVHHGPPTHRTDNGPAPNVSFEGEIHDGRVHLSWTLSTADRESSGLASFDVWESEQWPGESRRVNAAPIAVVPGQERYEFSAELPGGWDRAWYQLTGQNTTGSTFILGRSMFDVPPSAIPDMRGYPRPFAGVYTVEVDVSADDVGELIVYDLSGRRVRTLLSGALQKGRTTVRWDGTDDAGRRARAGVYVLQLTTHSNQLLRKQKVTILR